MKMQEKTLGDWTDLGWQVSPMETTQWTIPNGVHQDGDPAFARGSDGAIWALLSHTNSKRVGPLTVWRGRNVDAMEKMWEARLDFKLGEAGEAFDGTRYPSGPLSRGQVWPMGLWIDKRDGEFVCFIHNETAEGAGASSYAAQAVGKRAPNDFRHIGVMTSKDQGRSWGFRGWILSDMAPMYTTAARPDGIAEGGQELDDVCLGPGDFSSFANERDGHLYIFYQKHMLNLADPSAPPKRKAGVFVSRAPMEGKGMPGTWRNWHAGSFSEPGIGGRSDVVFNAEFEYPGRDPSAPAYTDNKVGQPNATWNAWLGKYMMACSCKLENTPAYGTLIVALSDDLVNWTDARTVAYGRGDVWAPYYAITSLDDEGDVAVTGRRFRVFGAKGRENAIIRCDVTIEGGRHDG